MRIIKERMGKSAYLPFSIALLLLNSGCYINKAMVDPYTYAPPSYDDYWTPTKYALRKSKVTQPLNSVLPNQKEPLTLAELIDLALINNTQTAETWAKARESAAQYGQTQSTALPSITGEFDYFRTREASFFSGASAGGTGAAGSTSSGTATGGTSTSSIFIETFSQWGPQLRLTYTLFDFGKLRATSEAARQALYYADYTHNREIQTVVQTISTDYYNVLYQEELLNAYLANVETAKMTLDAADLGIKTGVQDISDVLQARTQLLQYEIMYVGQKQNVQNTYAGLLNNMGLPATLDFKLEQLPEADPKDDDLPNVDDLIQAAMDSRPDYLAAQAEVKSKDQSLKAAKREVYPKVNYLLDFGKTYFTGWVNDRYDYTSAFTVSMPLFRGFYYKNNIKAAVASKDEAEIQLKEIELAVIKDVSTTHYNVKIAFDTLKYAKRYLASAEEQYRVALEQYKAGTNNILNVVSAQSSLADARAKFVKATQDWYTSLANLAYAIGIVTKPSTNL